VTDNPQSMGLDGVVGIVTQYGLDGEGIIAVGGEIFRTHPDQPRCPPSLLHNGYRFHSWGLSGWGVALTTHPHLVQKLKKEHSYTSNSILGASYTMGTGFILGAKWLGRGIDNPPPPSAKAKEGTQLYLYFHSGPM